MDGVLADFVGGTRQLFMAAYPDVALPIPAVPDYFIYNDYPLPYRAAAREIPGQAGFSASLPLMPGAIEGWERLLELRCQPRICSTPQPPEVTPTAVADKQAWLEEHFVPRFGNWVLETAIFTADKHKVPAPVLVDDKPPKFMPAITPWKHVVFGSGYIQTELTSEHLHLPNWHDENLPAIIAAALQKGNDSFVT